MSGPRPRDIVLAEVRRTEAALEELDRARADHLRQLEALRAELELPLPVAPPPATQPGLAPSEKVKLFRGLFRGRIDVYPTRFVSKKTGKAGYAPACANKWHPTLCHLKSGGKCSDCAHTSFAPVTDQVIEDHLTGKHVAGVYPLLEDETCWFLAADFDKDAWRQDVAAFRETCRAFHLPVAVERSRSGNGAHAWFFFTAPVKAELARRMGCFLLTETMIRRHELSMESYDRLFPSQDTMPRGGFGNLIALPLQREARQQGHSVFVDDAFIPHTDQWAFLAAVQRVTPSAVESLARDAVRTGNVLGVRTASPDDEEPGLPWNRPPSGSTAQPPITSPLPPVVRGTLAQRCFIEKAGLPPSMLTQLKRLAAFQNPEFYKRQKMRLSTALTPRVISCSTDVASFKALPRGCTQDAVRLFADHGVRLELSDERHVGPTVTWTFNGSLTAVQEQAAQALLQHDDGIVVAPPGTGKTVLGTYLVAQRACSALILVHRKPLLEQWIAQLAMFLGIEEEDIGQVGGGKRKPNGRLDVAMIQSLIRRNVVDDLVAGYGHVLVDECHHLPAVSFERVLAEVKARYVVGLTATPKRRDGHHPISEMQLGPVRFRVDAKRQAAHRPFSHTLIVRETGFSAAAETIQDVYRLMAADEARNDAIIADVVAALREGRSPVILTERKDHLELLVERLRPLVRNLVVLQGGMGARAQRAVAAQLESIPTGQERVIVATGRFIGEGFDDARLDTLFLAMPVAWKGTLVQYCGRLHRLHPGKTDVRVYDYVDSGVPMLLRMFERRLPTYRAIGYARGEAPLGFAEPREELTIEYDDESVRQPAETWS